MIVVRPPLDVPLVTRCIIDARGRELLVAEFIAFDDDLEGAARPAIVAFDIDAIEAINVAFGVGP